MIKSLKVTNFRSLAEETEFQFAPVTILTGANNSGKSTVIQALRILKDQVFNKEHKLTSLRMQKLSQQLGNISNIINYRSKTNQLSFEYPFHLNPDRKENNRFIHHLQKEWQLRLCYEINSSNEEEALLNTLELINPEQEKVLSVEKQKDEVDYWLKLDINKLFHRDFNQELSTITYFNFGREIVHPGTVKEAQTIQWSSLSKYYQRGYSIFEEYLNDFDRVLFKRDEVTGLAEMSDGFYDNFADLLDFYYPFSNSQFDFPQDLTGINYTENFNQFTESLHFLLKEIFLHNAEAFNFTHLAPLRGLSKRVFLNNEDLAIPNAANKYFFNQDQLEPKMIQWRKKWINVFTGGDDIDIERTEGIATSLFIVRENQRISLADFGYGASQLIPIILEALNCAMEYNTSLENKVLIIEEPEANLHPNFQSQLADFFIDLYKELNVHVILETHSEYLIRKLQYIVAKGNAGTANFGLYYFQQGKKPREIKILQDGTLDQEFGEGFYDEANRLSIELLKLKSFQHN